jgi:hypothetical protein
MSTAQLLNAAETWQKIYTAFDTINFTAYDYDAVKQSLINYLKTFYAENFNDYTEDSLMIAIIELFAFISEQIAYRVDMATHENLITDAQRKQSILRLAKLVSYSSSRNVPLRGLVKINTISISENIQDSQGNSLSNRVITWNDPNNPLWNEQFILCFNQVATQEFGSPFKSFQVDDTIFQQYEASNVLEADTGASSFKNGVLPTSFTINGQSYPFELVPADIDQNGVFERAPNPSAYFSLIYANDGYGNASPTTGFMMFMKQGTMNQLNYTFNTSVPNTTLDITLNNINDTDVWVQAVDAQGVLQTQWEEVPNVNGLNLAFNTLTTTTKYEVESLENDQIRLVFGDGDFAQIPIGSFTIWARQSNSGTISIQPSQVVNQAATFLYTSQLGTQESVTFTYNLVSPLQNSAPSETVEHIRNAAPAGFYNQNRMVNGPDYNTFMLQDSSILRLYAVNRTFAGQSKYLTFNDASGSYQNVKLFGDDLRIYYDTAAQATVTTVSSRSLIDNVLEPALSDPGIYNLLVYAYYQTADTILNLAFVTPRTKFIEDSTVIVDGMALLEKTLIQGVLDRHWYGEPDSYINLDVNLNANSSLPQTTYAVVNGDADHLIYDSNQKLALKNYATGTYSPVNTSGDVSGIQEGAIRQKFFGIGFNPQRDFSALLQINPITTNPSNIPASDNLSAADVTQIPASAQSYTIEIIDAIVGTFSVYSSITGYCPDGQVGETYSNGYIAFLIGFPPNVDQTLTPGDAFIINVVYDGTSSYIPTIYRQNLMGEFTIIPENVLPTDAASLTYNVDDPAASWIMLVQRTDDSNGNVSYWTVTTRNFSVVAESPTTLFWYNKDLINIVDPTTQLPVRDHVKLLRSNLNSDGTVLGTDQSYDVVGPIINIDGTTNFNALAISPSDSQNTYYSGSGIAQSTLATLNFIGNGDYLYFSVDPTTGNLIPIAATIYLDSLNFTNDTATSGTTTYVRRLGRDTLDFLWQHFTPNENLIDPSPTNIVDIYVLTRGYYTSLQSFIQGNTSIAPIPPTALDLRTTYATLIESKMISDTVVMHPGSIKLLFGSLAAPQFQANFVIVQSGTGKLTADQVRAAALDQINAYFQIDNWDFGQSFYAPQLCAVIQQALSTEVSSVVLVPTYPTNYFGDLMYLQSAPDEVFISAATIANVQIVTSLNRLTLKQKS